MALSNTEHGHQHKLWAELQRIISLPIYQPFSPEEVEAFSRTNVLGHAFDAGFRLNAKQCESVYCYDMYGGTFGKIGVGHGKTLASLMLCDRAFRKGVERQVLFIPSHVLPQLTQQDIKWARARVPFAAPIHVVAGRDQKSRRQLAMSKNRGAYIFTYPLLSSKDAEELLYLVNPGKIVCDEVHHVRHPAAARTQRLFRYFRDFPNTEFSCLSGTITNKSIKDYYHLIRTALKANCPLPLITELLNQWADILDSGAEETESPDAGAPLIPIIEWAKFNFPEEPISINLEGFRSAFKLRLNHAPGVVSSGDLDIGTSLTICTAPVPDYKNAPGFKQLQELMDQVELAWKTPSGDEIEHAFHKWKYLYELTSGFYNQLAWPTPETYALRKNISEQEAFIILEKAREQHDAEQEYVKVMRRWIYDKQLPGLDTPLLVASELARNGDKTVATEVYTAWRYAKALEFVGCPVRDSLAVRVCDYKIREAVKWASEYVPKGEGALMWVFHEEPGLWLYEYLFKAGLDPLYCPAGNASNVGIIDKKNAGRIIVASTPAHGEGKNLQHFRHNYFLQWPRNASKAEQALGRTHRTGQTADELWMFTNTTTDFDENNFAACCIDALYAHQTTGDRQKLIYANYNPMPRILPPSVLRQRGFDNQLLNARQQYELAEKFGPCVGQS